jgi:hypothetical protein
MENIEVKVDGDKLIITIPDVTNHGRPSSTGKTRLIATTAGSVPVDRPKIKGLKVALNVTVPA